MVKTVLLWIIAIAITLLLLGAWIGARFEGISYQIGVCALTTFSR